jgi:hypothetical protein
MYLHTFNIGERSPYRTKRGGYILLISILAIGVIASAILSSLLLLGTSASHVSISIGQSSQALAAAQACAEYALLQLRTAPTYPGDELLDLNNGSCELLQIGGIGNNNRLLCLEGRSGDATRRLEIVVNQLLPETTITSWQEVTTFSLCQ